MKNKIRYIALFLVMTFVFSGNVYAVNEFELSSSVSPAETIVGEVASISFSLESNDETGITSCSLTVTPDANLEYSSTNGANNWQINVDNNKFLISDPNGNGLKKDDGKKLVFILKYKVKGNANVAISDIKCSNETVEFTQADMTVEIISKLPSEDTSLSSLTVTNGTLDGGEIKTGIFQYGINLNKSEFSLQATPTNPNFKDKIVFRNGDSKAILDPTKIVFLDPNNQSNMLIEIIVNGDESNMYKLMVKYKTDEKPAVGELISLSINGKNVDLQSGKYDYEVVVGKNVQSFTVVATIDDETRYKFSERGKPGTFSINGEILYVPLIVVPKDTDGNDSKNDVANYTITVKKEALSMPSASDGITNPQTSGISLFIMASIIIASLAASIFLYKKNMKEYN